MKAQLMIPAAGRGLRLGSNLCKALARVGGEPLLVRTLKRFLRLGLVEGAVIIVQPEHFHDIAVVLMRAFPGARFVYADGGSERQISVGNGLRALDPDTDLVIIHDAARPFVSEEAIRASIEAAEQYGAATVAIPATDTVLQSDTDGFLAGTPDRSRLWMCQTPQTFPVPVIRKAHEEAQRGEHLSTDDASLVRRTGQRVKLVRGTSLNLKITTPADLVLAECIVREGLA